MPIVHSNPFYHVSQESYTLPSGYSGTYYGIRGLRTAFIVPFVTDNEVVIIKQWRYLFKDYVWEFPAGRIDSKEQPLQAAQRELQEETGYQAADWKSVGWFAPCNGLSDERTYVFIARQLTPVCQALDDTEDLTVHHLPIDDFERMLDNNTVHDGMTLAAWTLAKTQR